MPASLRKSPRKNRGKEEEHENTERWMVSYADFITLLFAFFVVMYSMSSINEGKYRVLSDTMENAFKTPPKSADPIQLGEPKKTISPIEGIIEKEQPVVKLKPAQVGDRQQMAKIAANLARDVRPLIDQKLVKVSHNKLWVEVEMNTNILFRSGEAAIATEGYPILEEMAEALKRLPNHIDVEGHTDNQPISTAVYPSNWELSAARAASVVHLFTKNGVDPARLSAIGYGEFRPVAANDSVEGRSKNRRVRLVILADKNARRMVEIESQMNKDQ